MRYQVTQDPHGAERMVIPLRVAGDHFLTEIPGLLRGLPESYVMMTRYMLFGGTEPQRAWGIAMALRMIEQGW